MWGDFNLSNNQATHKLLFKEFIDHMDSKGCKLIIVKPKQEKWDPRPVFPPAMLLGMYNPKPELRCRYIRLFTY